MDRLELELRALLSDERLDVPLRPGAVGLVKDGVRRRRRNRAILSSAAAGIVVLATVTTSALAVRATHDGDAVLPGTVNTPTPSSSATSSPTPTASPAAVHHGTPTIAWRPTNYTATKPFAFPGTVPSSTPWCTSKGLSLTASTFQGATGAAAGGITITNTGATCAVQGVPIVTGLAADGTVIAVSTPTDDFVVHPWFVLTSGHRATTSLLIFGDNAPCQLGAVSRIAVDLGHGGRELSTDIASAGAGPVTPRCGTAPTSQQVDHYTVSADQWLRPDGTPKLAVPQLSVAIAHAPRTAMQGTIVHFQVVASGAPPTRPCLPYREQLTSQDGLQTVIVAERHLLNCAAIERAPNARSYLLDMQVRVPTDAPVGDASLAWETPLPGIAANDGTTIRITAAPARCGKQQLTLTPGASTTTDGDRKDVFVFTNTSAKACSLHGIPGDAIIAASGKQLRTHDRRLERTRFWNVAKQTYVLAPHGGTASFAVAGAATQPDGSSCPAAQGWKFIPPNDTITDQMYVAASWPWCDRGQVLISPVVPGTHGP